MPPKLITDTEAFFHHIFLYKEKKYTVIATNGCFDLLHEGHLHLLKKAKKLGDILIVLVNSDNSVRRLKGNNRPIEPLSIRMENLARVEDVDYVLSFEEDTPEIVIEKLRPHILVKGADYEGKQVAGIQYCKEMIFIPLLEGHSTTAKIRERKYM